MKKIKKIISKYLVLALATANISAFSVVDAGADVNGYDGRPVSGTLVLNQETDVVYTSVEEDVSYYSFTPSEDGIYSFYSFNNHSYEVVGNLCDGANYPLMMDYGNGVGANFDSRCELTAGQTYYFWLSYSGRYGLSDATGTVKIGVKKEKPIKDISIVKPQPLKIRENTKGSWTKPNGNAWMGSGDKYYKYSEQYFIWLGDKLVIDYEDGTSDTYVLGLYNYTTEKDENENDVKYMDWVFKNEAGDYISYWEVRSEQSYSNQWTVGNTYNAFFTYCDKKATIPVTIIPSNEIEVSDGVSVLGYQVNSSVSGMRTVYSVADEIDGKRVVKSGLVYGIYDSAQSTQIDDFEYELYVRDDNYYVRYFESTQNGVLPAEYQTVSGATSYAMTMTFSTDSWQEFNTDYVIRAFAQLEDGSFVYSNAYKYNVNNIAQVLYGNSNVNQDYKNQLFDVILSKNVAKRYFLI